jgi:hypothetical protein
MNKELEILLIKQRLKELKLEEIEIEKKIIKERLKELILEESKLENKKNFFTTKPSKSETELIDIIKEIKFSDTEKLNLLDIKLKESKNSFNIYA